LFLPDLAPIFGVTFSHSKARLPPPESLLSPRPSRKSPLPSARLNCSPFPSSNNTFLYFRFRSPLRNLGPFMVLPPPPSSVKRQTSPSPCSKLPTVPFPPEIAVPPAFFSLLRSALPTPSSPGTFSPPPNEASGSPFLNAHFSILLYVPLISHQPQPLFSSFF